MSNDVILVTGGTGNIGAAVVARLAADVSAPRVRVASRDHRSKGAALVRSLNPETVTPVPFDVDRPDTMRRCKELGVSDIGKHFYGEAAGGWFAKIDDELFVKLLGRHTTPFTKFVMDHAAYFGGTGGD